MDAVNERYHREGCLKIENFLTLEEVEELRKGLKDVVDNMVEENTHVFSVYGVGKQKESDEYYIHSGDKIRYFFENDAFDSEAAKGSEAARTAIFDQRYEGKMRGSERSISASSVVFESSPTAARDLLEILPHYFGEATSVRPSRKSLTDHDKSSN
ncbi:phytanoyl-CoA dioxygenase domain-containing protein 1 [Trichonephila clavipes]|nr:phytanoyl-CoA dioxygenase domain-containing protein 1 [Trichonephila clavipes]